jgi:hypothetical protein
MNDLFIVTIATESKFYFPYLVESCKKNGKELIVLGYDKKWEGFSWKFKLMIDFLKTLNDNDIVCFIDGYDVICTRNLLELKNTFIEIRNKTKCKIIVGHDKLITDSLFYYFSKEIVSFYYDTCKNINLNAGTYIGYAKDLLEVLQQTYNIEPEFFADDQKLIIKYCNLNPENIFIDINCNIFMTIVKPLANIDYLVSIKNNQIIYKNNKPFFIHGPGGTYLDNIVKLLGYKITKSIDNKLFYNGTITRITNFLTIDVNYNIKKNKSIYLIIIFLCIIYFILKKNYNHIFNYVHFSAKSIKL